MCGIAGILDKNRVGREVLEQMCSSLYHRGPDDEGVYLNKDSVVGLGHRRLSIIDLSSQASQPMSNENGKVWLVFNGEFYNYQDYRLWLQERGHKFKSRSDSEMVIHLYEELGLSFLKKIRGMFALGLWDEDKKRLLLARDRVGKKPLYYASTNNAFAFASEIKALLKVPNISREIDLDALNFYFAFGYIPQALSIFRDIRKLPPGHYLIYQRGEIEVKRYWDLPAEGELVGVSEEELLSRLEELLEESVKLRMISDVPLGVFLSGGVDSSIVAALMAKHSSEPIKTFSIGFDEDKYNELPFARKVAQYIGSDHHEFIVKPDAAEVITKLANQYDEPFADSSAVPTYYVSKMAREHVKVVLSGDGGDELFAGYNWYWWVKEGELLSRALGPLSNLVGGFARMLPKEVRGKHFLERIGLNGAEQFIRRVSIFDEEQRRFLLNRTVLGETDHRLPEKSVLNCFGNDVGDSVAKMQRFDFKFYLPDDILVKVDRASMLVSLEVRAPLLDHLVCEFSFKVPEYFKLRGRTKKYLLKQLARRLLPADFPLERKQGFSIPLREWMSSDLSEMFGSVLFYSNLGDYIDMGYVTGLFKEHAEGRVNHGARLWSILMFGLWMENYS